MKSINIRAHSRRIGLAISEFRKDAIHRRHPLSMRRVGVRHQLTTKAFRIVASMAFATWMIFGVPLTAYAVDALSSVWRINHYKHTAFSADQGAPENVAALAQTTDGYLWVGSGGQGLQRFDGLKFSHFEPAKGEGLLSPQIAALSATPDGGLWIGYEFQGISFLKDGHLTHYGVPEGFKLKFVNRIFEGYRGRVYALGTDRLLALNEGKWSSVMRDDPKMRIHAAASDDKGILWLAGDDRFFWCREDDCHLVDTHVEAPRRIISLVISPSNVLYASEMAGSTRRFRIEGSHLRELSSIPTYTVAPSFDRHGGVWLPSLGDGVLRLISDNEIQGSNEDNPTREAYRKMDGLTGDYVWPSIVDSEGDIWVGTQHGIDRFRETSFVGVTTPPGIQSPKVVPASRGEAWVGSSSVPLMRWDGTSLLSTAFGTFAFAICSDQISGKTWMANADGLWELTDLGAKHLASAPAGPKLKAFELACRNDGRMLAEYQQPVGGNEWVNGEWKRRPDLDLADMIEATPDGRFFVGHDHNRLLVIEDAKTHEYGAAEGLNVGSPKALAVFKNFVFLGGTNGLAVLVNGRFHSLLAAGARPFADITGLSFDDSGALWIHMPSGAARIASEEISSAMEDPKHALNYRWFSPVDGMPGVPAQDNPSPSLSKGTDGRLWFTSQSGIAWLDPSELIANKNPPKPTIELIVDDGVRHPVNRAQLLLPPQPRTIELDFNAPLLRAAEGGHFLYRLKGVDNDWQEAGNRREAFYSNLGPGEYKFQVRAANESGLWSESDASVTFRIQPTYYETWWFRAICGLMLLAILYISYVIHIRQVTAKIRIREDERLRIARDLHDTLLQSVQAMLAKVEAIKDRSLDPWTRAEAEQVAEWGRQAVSEGRTKVGRLRTCKDDSNSPLWEAIDIVKDLSDSTDLVLHTTRVGEEPALNPLAAHEVASVIREVATNALRHSKGKNVWLSMAFGSGEFIAVVRDDGRGVDANVIAASEQAGHWGLRGAKERIGELGGTLAIQDASPTGTEVVVRVPAHRMYQRSSTGVRA